MKIFYHASKQPLQVGTILKPTGKQHTQADEDLEWYRPKGSLSRLKSVFLFDDLEAADVVGVWDTDHIYTVVPLGPIEEHHASWVNILIHEVQSGASPEEIQSIAEHYWDGDEFGDAGWEYLTPSAKVVGYHGTLKDLERKEWGEEIEVIRRRAGL